MILNVAKANIEIQRLKAALKEAEDKLSVLAAKAATGSCTCSCEACSDCEQKDDEGEDDGETSKKKHKHHAESSESALKVENGVLQARLQEMDSQHRQSVTLSALARSLHEKEIEKLKAEHQKALDEKEADVEKRASAKAAAITAGQGQPALTLRPEDTPAKPKPATGLKGLDLAIAAHKSSVNY